MGHPPWALYIPSFLKVDATFLATVLGSQARSADGLYRVRGPYGNSLIFAEFLALCAPFILHWLLTARSMLLRWSLLFGWALVIWAILVTQSRLGLVGTIVAVMTYVPLWGYRQWRVKEASIAGPAMLFGAPLIALALIAVVFSSHRMTMSILGSGAQASSNEGRSDQLSAAIPLIAKNPIGYGLGQGAQRLNFHAPNGTLTVDNGIMTTTLDLGLLGLIGYYGMFGVAAVICVRTYLTTNERENELAGPLASMLVAFLVICWVLAEEYNHSLVILLVGMALALGARERHLGSIEAS